MASPTQGAWVWVNSRSWQWTGRPGVLQSMGLQRVGDDWANWPELNWTIKLQLCMPYTPEFPYIYNRKSQTFKTCAKDVLQCWNIGEKSYKCSLIYVYVCVCVCVYTHMYTPGERNGNPLQYSHLENPRDRGGLVGYYLCGHRVGYNWVTK